MSRTRELSDAVLEVLDQVARMVRIQKDPRQVFEQIYKLSPSVSNSLAEFLEEHLRETFLVPTPNRILIEEVESQGLPTYVVTTCRGRAFNMALGNLFAALAKEDEINILEASFDENGFLLSLVKKSILSCSRFTKREMAVR